MKTRSLRGYATTAPSAIIAPKKPSSRGREAPAAEEADALAPDPDAEAVEDPELLRMRNIISADS